MDITEGSPAAELSNFTPRTFTFRGLLANSMEGLLQGLKFRDSEKQKQVMLLVGKAAKFKGKKQRWWLDQTLFWQGSEIKRDSEEFQLLLDEAFAALFTQNEGARATLLATGTAIITHTMGKQDPLTTVLTEQEFVSRLMRIRACLTAA
jgi:predicted NAD-dependent protein-ADP-ribosyltransferase YbiA (DUF1768 family)